MSIATAHNGDVQLAYERTGRPDGMPMLLFNGSGAQMTMWPADFHAALVERGFQVARMDTRDTGLSTHLTRYDVPRRRRPPRYTLRDITDDAVAVLDALGWPAAHLLGVSGGGMLAQAVATWHPHRVRSLTSISSTSVTSPLLNRQRVRTVLRLIPLLRRVSRDRDDEGQKMVELFRALSTRRYPADEEHWREAGRVSFDRGLYPRGDARVVAAIVAEGDRRRALRQVRCPTLVLHGEADPLCAVRGGRTTADAIAGARFVTYPETGHDLPRPLWPDILGEVTALARRAEADLESVSSP